MKLKSKIAIALLLLLLMSSTFPFLVYAQTPSAGISLTVTPSKTSVESGGEVSYLYNASNTGETALTGAVYDYHFGAVGSFVDLQPGGWVGYNITHILTEDTTNEAIAYGVDQYDQNVTDTATAFVQVTYPSAGISLTVTPSKTAVLPGTPVSYLYNATNTGEVPLTGNVTDATFGAVGAFLNLQPGGWVGWNVTHVITMTTSNAATAYGFDQYGQLVMDSDSAFVQVDSGTVLNPTIESCDSAGATKDTFSVADGVYVKGTGYSLSTTYDLYVVQDVAVWSDGMKIPARVFGTATTLSSDAGGNVPATLVWPGLLVLGKYDVVVDVNGNGVYDEGVDALDDGDIEVTAGLNVIPEVPLGTIAIAASMGLALFGYKTINKPRKKMTK